MAAIAIKQFLREFLRVDQVAVMTQGYAVRRVDVERLGLGGVIHSRGGVAGVADADPARQPGHISRFEHIPDQSAAFMEMDLIPIERGDADTPIPQEHGLRVLKVFEATEEWRCRRRPDHGVATWSKRRTKPERHRSY